MDLFKKGKKKQDKQEAQDPYQHTGFTVPRVNRVIIKHGLDMPLVSEESSPYTVMLSLIEETLQRQANLEGKCK